jgi:hypothetical protein
LQFREKREIKRYRTDVAGLAIHLLDGGKKSNLNPLIKENPSIAVGQKEWSIPKSAPLGFF